MLDAFCDTAALVKTKVLKADTEASHRPSKPRVLFFPRGCQHFLAVLEGTPKGEPSACSVPSLSCQHFLAVFEGTPKGNHRLFLGCPVGEKKENNSANWQPRQPRRQVLREAVASVCVLPSRLVLEATTGTEGSARIGRGFSRYVPRAAGVFIEAEILSSSPFSVETAVWLEGMGRKPQVGFLVANGCGSK